MTTYTAKVRRGERFWLVHVPEIDQTTQARNLAEVDEMARSLISIMLEIDPDSFDIKQNLEFPPAAYAHWARSSELREEAASKQAEAAAEARAAAKDLAANGLTLRDIGAVLEVSHQRASQLVNS